MNTSPNETITILCYGNPAREDDGIGPELARRLEVAALPNVQVESDYQLMVEDAAVIADSAVVVFADAAIAGEEPFAFRRVPERGDIGYMAHSIDPERLLGLTRATFGRCPPAYALAIRGYSFEMFKEGLSARAAGNLEEAVRFLGELLADRAGELRQLRAGNVPAAPLTNTRHGAQAAGNVPQEA